MEESQGALDPSLVIETIHTVEGHEVSYCPVRGGMITSLKFTGKEVLYFDTDTFSNTQGSVRGGISILFPNAGEVGELPKSHPLSGLKRHGFARDVIWKSQKTEHGFIETLVSNPETKKVYPYDFKLTLEGKFENGSFILTQQIENKGTDPMPVSSGLHPYFKVPADEKKSIKFNFPGGKSIENEVEKWVNGETVFVDNPGGPFEVSIPGLGTLICEVLSDCERLWIWSEAGKNFICMEPVMRDPGGITQNPLLIQPGQTHISFFKVRLG